jgi:DNA-binding phage protein
VGAHERKGDPKPKRSLNAAVRRWTRELPADRIIALQDKLRIEVVGEKERPLIRALRDAIEGDPRTINAIAVEAGLSAAAVWRFVQGERGLSLDSAAALADTLGLHLVDRRQNERQVKSGRAHRVKRNG